MRFQRSTCEAGEESALDGVEGAAAKDGGDDGAGGLGVTQAEVAAIGVAVIVMSDVAMSSIAGNGHFRNQRDADAGRDHPEKTAELLAFEGDVRSDAAVGAGAGADAEVAEAVAVAEHDEGFAAEILEGEGFCGGARVVLGQYGEERLGADGGQFEFFVAQGESENRDVER